MFRVGQSKDQVDKILLFLPCWKRTTYALYHKQMCLRYTVCTVCVWLFDFFYLTTVSKGSGLHLLLGLLVTEVTVAMGSWKLMKGYSCVPFYVWLLAHFIQAGRQHIQICCCPPLRLTAEGGGEVTHVWTHLRQRVDTHTNTPTHSWYKSMVPL